MTQYLLSDHDGHIPCSAIVSCNPHMQAYNHPHHNADVYLLLTCNPSSSSFTEDMVTVKDLENLQINLLNMAKPIVFDVQHPWRIFGSALDSPYRMWMFDLSEELPLELIERKDGELTFRNGWAKETQSKDSLSPKPFKVVALYSYCGWTVPPTVTDSFETIVMEEDIPEIQLFIKDLWKSDEHLQNVTMWMFKSEVMTYQDEGGNILVYFWHNRQLEWVGDSLTAKEAQTKVKAARQNSMWEEFQSLAESPLFPYMKVQPINVDAMESWGSWDEETGTKVGTSTKELVYPFDPSTLLVELPTPGPILSSSLLPSSIMPAEDVGSIPLAEDVIETCVEVQDLKASTGRTAGCGCTM
ncbi:hypothetical protein EDD18DRAFT_1113874 [Armillaria luteobubalina]|uniref:Uncharacterized protein n=1 Tax=Armillaria luteobubalina TaxID=153913 RepID=A0AA39P864_9AGAR|nr:hypothetical protein EDD18DRAFT_1113874 [Armillaria luteobubalina]